MTFLRLFTLIVAALFTVGCGVDDVTLNDEFAGEELSAADFELATSTGKFEVFEGKDGKFYFHLLAGNGENVLRSQGYTTRSGAKSGVETVKTNGVLEQRYLIREASNGDFYFVLIAGNGRIIGMSELYVSQANAQRGMTTVRTIITNTVEKADAQPGLDRFETFRGLDGKYYFHLKAMNGQIVLQSQGYTTKASATNGIDSVITNGSNPARYEVLPAADGQYYFRLKASNGRVIGRSELYVTKYNAERGVETVMNVLNTAVK